MHEPFVAICSRVAQSHHDCGASPRLWCFAAMSSVRSESVDSGMTAASGDVGEEVHFLSDRAWDLVDIQSERRAADQSTDLVGQTPFLAPATAGSANAGHQYSRTPHCPYNEREDVGLLSMYQGNWGGHRSNKQLSQHIINDVIKKNPCHIVVAQEVDAKTAQSMRDMINPESRPSLRAPAIAGQASSSSGASSSAVPAIAGLSSSAAASATAEQPMWIVVVGDASDSVKTNLVAARSTYAKDIKVLEWHKTHDGSYKGKLSKKQRANLNHAKRMVDAISRILVVEVTLKQPWAGRTKITIANVHLHYMTAKGEGPFKDGSLKWWAGFRSILERFDVDIVAGDFNMALWKVVPTLRRHQRIVALVSAFAFCTASSTAAIAEGNEDEDEDGSEENLDPASGSAEPQRASATAEPATASAAARVEHSRRYTAEQLNAMTPSSDVHSDSCGIFLLKTASKIHRILSVESFLRGSGLKTFPPKSQGYPYKSYKGGVDAVRETFLYSQEAFVDTRDGGVLRDIREQVWPPVKERSVDFEKFDPDNMLFTSGAHAPLMVWIGSQGRRSQESLAIREENAIRRGWGPGSARRARSMTREGKGPVPERVTRERGDDRTRESGAAP